MSLSHAELVVLAEKWLMKTKGCSFAIRELCVTKEHPDVIAWRCSSDYTVVIECKTSLADFIKDQKKPFRQDIRKGMGTFRFYFCEEGVITVEQLPKGWGLIVVSPTRGVVQLKGPKGNAWGRRDIDFYHTKKNDKAETLILTSALRRIHIHGVLDLIYAENRPDRTKKKKERTK